MTACPLLLLAVVAPVAAILTAVLMNGKGYPDAARKAAWGSAGVLGWPPLLTVSIAVSEWLDVWAFAPLAGFVALALCVFGNDQLARATSDPAFGPPPPDPTWLYRAGTAVCFGLTMATSAAAFLAFSLLDPMQGWGFAVFALPALFAWTLVPLWIAGGGVGMALVRAFSATRLYEDDRAG